MLKYIVTITVSAIILAGCGRAHKAGQQQTAKEPAKEASSCGHDHSGHDHSAHAPAADSHAGHNHAATDSHAGHNHAAAESHAGHDHSGHDHAKPAPAEEESTHADEIIFPAAQAALTDFAVEQINPAPLRQVIRTSGQILPAQGDQVCLSAPVSGILSFGGVKLTEGSRIAKGQNIFYISSKNLATGDATDKITANYLKTKADYERMKELVADQIVSQKDYEAAKYAYQEAKAAYDAISAVTTPRGTAVVAPMSGFLVEVEVHEGDFVELGAVLASVSQNRRMELRAEVSQKYYSQLKSIRSARFRTPYGDAVLSINKMNGRLISVGQATPASGYMIPVIFEFDNPGDLMSGSYVEVYLLGTAREGVLSVPQSAITEQQGFYYVYVQLDEEGYQRREVKLGANDGERVEILSGIKAGERVVTRGAIQVKMAASSGEIPHGHSH